MAPYKKWFVIVNPTSGNGLSKKKWPKIKALLIASGFEFEHVFTSYSSHSSSLVAEATESGFRHIICVGGDGTLHNIVNGIMSQNKVASNEVFVGVIPIGTGNDWVKTYNIPNDYEKAIQIIKNGTIKTQDLGKINFLKDHKSVVYFNNLAGVGFDGYVVSKVHKYKHFGALSYLTGALLGLFSFKNFQSKVMINEEEISTKTLMILVGLCKYSGGGMQLTQTPNPFDGLLDVSIAKDFSKLDIIKNLSKLFNGKITNHKKVGVFKTKSLTIALDEHSLPFIQADGELIGKGDIRIELIEKAFSFYC